MNLKFILCTTALLYVSNVVEGSKILGVFWTPSKSHHILGSALLQALAKKGHNVTLMSSFIDDVDTPNFKQIKLEGIIGISSNVTNPNNSMLQQMWNFFKTVTSSQENFWRAEPIQRLLKTREQYDVVIALPVMYDGQLALFHHLGAPVILFFPGASNFLVNKYVANPNWVESAPIFKFGSGSTAGVTNPNSSFIMGVISFSSNIKELTKKFWENEPIQNLVSTREQYDVILSINFLNDGILALNHHLGAPTIVFFPGASSFVTNRFLGNPTMAYTPHPLYSAGSHRCFLARLAAVTLNALSSKFLNDVLGPIQESASRLYLPNSPSVKELRDNISLVMVNSHTSMEPIRPYVPNMVQIGGFYAQTAKKLPENLQKYLDSAKEGAILFSFGTNMKIKDMESDKLQAILEGLRKIPHMKVLFKSEIELENAPKNVLVAKWLPQNDILAHPNMKVFITHGGLGGNTEAVYHGVPMIGIPLFADQNSNIENAVKAEYAIKVAYKDISQESIDVALAEILKNPKYVKNAKKRSSLLKNQPINPMDKAIWWVEHIIEHKGGEHLRNLGMDLEWYQLYMVDIIIFYLVVIIVMLTSSFLTMRWIIRKLFFRSSKKTKKD